jgi:hypothetical protein
MGLGSDICDFCRVSKDTTLHVLRDCVLVRPLWLSVVDTAMRYQFFSSNLNDWIALNVARKSGRNNYEDLELLLGYGLSLCLDMEKQGET